MLALLYVLGPPLVWLAAVWALYAVHPVLGWMLVGAGWGMLIYSRRR